MNIKIGKGGSGSVNSTKGGSGKTNQKKYIDLLPANFISKVTLSGGTYSNGTYTRSSGGTTTFDGPDGKTIVFSDPIWYAYDPLFNGGAEVVYGSFDLINWFVEGDPNPPNSPAPIENALTFLFDPVFYKNQIENERYKILLQGCSLSYVNGVYSLSLSMGLVGGAGYYIKDDDNIIIYYEIETARWVIEDTNYRDYAGFLFYKIGGASSTTRPFEFDWSTPDGGDAYDDGQTPPTMSEYLNLQYRNGGRLDPAFLEQVRSYQIDGSIPNQNLIPQSMQHIVSASFNTKKAEIKNNTFSYIKYSDNTDVEQKKLNRWYGTISNTQSNYSINPPKDSKYPLLKVRRNDSQPIFEVGPGKNSTLNMFIKLQRPLQHFRPGTSYLVREKRAIFCTGSDVGGSPFSIGYRSPYYNITGRPSYKSVFNNFSFVFSFGSVGYDATFGRPISRNLMTDYKFNFGEMYMLTIRSFDNYLAIYVNGELQEVAIVPFNPLVNPSHRVESPYEITLSDGSYNNGTYSAGLGATSLTGPDGKYIELNPSAPLSTSGPYDSDNMYSFDPAHPDFPNPIYTSADGGVSWFDNGTSSNPGTPPNGVINSKLQMKRLYKTRRDQMPLGPGFYKKDGTIYPNTDVESVFGSGNILSMFYLIFGKSSLAHGTRYINSKKKRRYLNNLDIGVISSYNAALSQSDISQIYDNFRYRYI